MVQIEIRGYGVSEGLGILHGIVASSRERVAPASVGSQAWEIEEYAVGSREEMVIVTDPEILGCVGH